MINEEKEAKLTPRQHRLKNYLDANFVSGKFFTIEEICNAGLGYTLNTNPRKHDKCIALSNDVRAINWLIGVERYIPIIKDADGGVKLCESKDEFDAWYNKIDRKITRLYQYINSLKSKVEMDGYVPIINLAGRALTPEEQKPIDTYKR